MQEWHSAGLNPTPKAVAHDQLVSRAQPLQEWHQANEIIGVICVSHDDEPAPRSLDATEESSAIAPIGDVLNPGTGLPCQILRAIRAAVIRHQHLARDAILAEKSTGLLHARSNGICLVQAGHENGQFHRLRLAWRSGGEGRHSERHGKLSSECSRAGRPAPAALERWRGDITSLRKDTYSITGPVAKFW